MKKLLGKRDQGFTLVELIVVIVVLAILIGVSISGYTKYIGQSRLNTDMQNAETIKSVLVNAAAEDGAYEALAAVTAETTEVVVKLSNTEMKITSDGTTEIADDSANAYQKAVKAQLAGNATKAQYTGGEITITAKAAVETKGDKTVGTGGVIITIEGNDKYPADSSLHKAAAG